MTLENLNLLHIRYEGTKAGLELPQIRQNTPPTQNISSPPSPSPILQTKRKKKSAHKKTSSTGERPLSPSQNKFSSATNATLSSTVTVNGIVFDPQTLSTHAGVASILMQQPGKDKMKEVKARRKSVAVAETMDASNADGESGETNKRGRQVKELIFEQLVKANMEYERSKELKWFVCTGRPMFTEEEKLSMLLYNLYFYFYLWSLF